MDTSFGSVIREHLELRERNAKLDETMPLERYHLNGTVTADATSPDLDDTAEIDDLLLALSGASGSDSWGSARSFDWGD